MDTTAVSPPPPTAPPVGADRGMNTLGGQEFFNLLIAQLTNQNPLQPTSNEELLSQIASIRDIELSSSITDSLKLLTGQQRFGSASSLIGRFVTAAPDTADAGGTPVSGVVVGVRFLSDGRAVLQLGSGAEVPLDQVASVLPARGAAESLVGKAVTGVDRSDPEDPQPAQGLVTALRSGADDEIVLELDTGQELRLRDVTGVGDASGVGG